MKQRIRIWLRNFFGFSRSEANGFIVMILCMIIILAAPIISRKFYSYNKKDLQSQSDKEQLNLLIAELENSIDSNPKSKKEAKYKTFDLNKSKVEDLIEAGFPSYLAERIVKYREKVKTFDSKSELLKIYGIDSSFYKTIYQYITVSIPVVKPNSRAEPITKQKKITKEKMVVREKHFKATLQPFDINKADSLQLQWVFGIGPTYSRRITKYRDYLGGFHSLEQLEEVYGLKQENLDSLKKYIFIAPNNNLKKLKVNKLTADSLVQHPYISYKEANLIVNYRNQHGEYTSANDLLSIKVLDSNWVKKVTPYFNFD